MAQQEKDELDPIEKAFGKKPKRGYKFNHIDIEIIDNDRFKGFDIGWSAQGIGFGHVCIAWGMGEEIKKDWPKQYGFHTDTEYMSDKFVKALMKAAAPKLAELIIKHDRSNTEQAEK